MKNPENIKELVQQSIDFMGLIFYEKSPRYVDYLNLSDLPIIPRYIERVGVFVNAELDYILKKTNEYGLDLIQLHGNESPEFCKELNKTMPIIKAFSISDAADFEQTKAYSDLWGSFLFDTKTPQYGGSGLKFDWDILDAYTGETPFLLSGGVSKDDTQNIKAIKHPKLYGVDLNSKFEIEPGLKDIELLQLFIKELKQ